MEEMKNIQEKAVKDREMQLARKNQEELKQLKKEEKAKKKAKQKQIKALSFNPDEDEDNEEETEEKSERYVHTFANFTKYSAVPNNCTCTIIYFVTRMARKWPKSCNFM